MAHIGLDVPNEPSTDYDIHAVISTFYLANRGRGYLSGMAVSPLPLSGRGYLSGMAVSPLPLSVRDISDVLAAHPVMLDRDVLDGCVFALDDIYLSEANEKAEKAEKAGEDNTN